MLTAVTAWAALRSRAGSAFQPLRPPTSSNAPERAVCPCLYGVPRRTANRYQDSYSSDERVSSQQRSAVNGAQQITRQSPARQGKLKQCIFGLATCMRAFWIATARFRIPLSRCRSASWPRIAAVPSALGACAERQQFLRYPTHLPTTTGATPELQTAANTSARAE